MPPPAKPDLSQAFAVPVRSGGSRWPAVGEHGLRRRPCRWEVTRGNAEERRRDRARVAATQSPNGVAVINPGLPRSPRDPVRGWEPGRLIAEFPAFINSEIALLCRRQGTALTGISRSGLRAPRRRTREFEGGLVGHALETKRVAHGPPSRRRPTSADSVSSERPAVRRHPADCGRGESFCGGQC